MQGLGNLLRLRPRAGLLREHEAGEKNTVQFYSNICNYSQAKNKAQSKVFSNVGINEHVLPNIMQAPNCIYVRLPEISRAAPCTGLAGFHGLEAAQT